MNPNLLFKFHKKIDPSDVPESLNNPFGKDIPKIAQIAAWEFQEYIQREALKWGHDFETQKGKMFGILVVQSVDQSFAYLGAVSGKLSNDMTGLSLVPSVFDTSTDDFFINKGMTELTELSSQIKLEENHHEIEKLKRKRKNRSLELQDRLFQNYRFINLHGKEKNLLEIFEDSSHGNPPSAAGECAAPKLLQYALKNHLKPIAVAEFWWGSPPKNNERIHKGFYPACKNKCRPILEYMLDDRRLFDQAN